MLFLYIPADFLYISPAEDIINGNSVKIGKYQEMFNGNGQASRR